MTLPLTVLLMLIAVDAMHYSFTVFNRNIVVSFDQPNKTKLFECLCYRNKSTCRGYYHNELSMELSDFDLREKMKNESRYCVVKKSSACDDPSSCTSRCEVWGLKAVRASCFMAFNFYWQDGTFDNMYVLHCMCDGSYFTTEKVTLLTEKERIGMPEKLPIEVHLTKAFNAFLIIMFILIALFGLTGLCFAYQYVRKLYKKKRKCFKPSSSDSSESRKNSTRGNIEAPRVQDGEEIGEVVDSQSNEEDEGVDLSENILSQKKPEEGCASVLGAGVIPNIKKDTISKTARFARRNTDSTNNAAHLEHHAKMKSACSSVSANITAHGQIKDAHEPARDLEMAESATLLTQSETSPLLNPVDATADGVVLQTKDRHVSGPRSIRPNPTNF